MAIKELWKDQRADERRRDLERITFLMEDYRTGNVDRFYQNMIADLFPWALALKEFVKLSSVPPEMQQAFRMAWVECKNVPLQANNHPLVCAAARVMLPAYTGPAVRLFRGACLNEHRRRAYSLSWTAEIDEAEFFAKERQEWSGGSVVLETLAPPAAIICQIIVSRAVHGRGRGNSSNSSRCRIRRFPPRTRVHRRSSAADAGHGGAPISRPSQKGSRVTKSAVRTGGPGAARGGVCRCTDPVEMPLPHGAGNRVKRA